MLGVVLVVTAVGSAAGVASATPVAPATQGDGLRADFDGDGITDLAIGVPDEDISVAGEPVAEDAGAVNVIYGTANGLTSTGNELWEQNSPGIFGDAQEDDQFGYALAAGDFDGDGRTDLAISAPGESFGGYQTGVVHVLYGTEDGLSADDSQFFSQNNSEIFGDADQFDQFGQSLAAADFDGDGSDDLVIGTPLESYVAERDGFVHVLYGHPDGLRATGSSYFSQHNAHILGDAQDDDHFGAVLATADFNGDDLADLAISTPQEDYMAENDGVVHVLYGTVDGLEAIDSTFLSQDDPNIYGSANEYDNFGYSLAAADFDRDGDGDLAIGTPFEDYMAENDGVVHVLYGDTPGLRSSGSDFFSQNNVAIYGDADEGDQFGYSLAAANFGRGAQADLAIGVPWESYMDSYDGGVHVLYGSSSGVLASDSQFWSQHGSDLVEDAEGWDNFGKVLAPGNFGNGGYADLAVGVPNETTVSLEVGGVHVIYGSLDGLTATGDQFWTQYALAGGEESRDHFGSALAAGG
jgi:hypothetical protein